MASTTRNILLLMLCFNLMLVAGGFNLVGDSNLLGNFVDVDENFNINAEGTGAMNVTPTDTPQAGEFGSNFWVFNVLEFVWDFVIFLINVTAAPIALFTTGVTLPPIIGLMIGVPLMVMYLLGLIWFIRGSAD